MNTALIALLSLVVSAAALLFTGYQFAFRNTKVDTSQLTTVIVKLENISSGINEIKKDIKDVKEEMSEIRERLVIVEQRSKSNTNRLNALDNRHDE